MCPIYLWFSGLMVAGVELCDEAAMVGRDSPPALVEPSVPKSSSPSSEKITQENGISSSEMSDWSWSVVTDEVKWSEVKCSDL